MGNYKDRWELVCHKIGDFLFKGKEGIEVGGLNKPLVFENTKMDYIDIITLEKAKKLFPEVVTDLKVNLNYVADICQHTIQEITCRKYDFVIAKQVIEHTSNPIKFLYNLITGVKDGGHLIISAPDKEKCFDKDRSVTLYNHLLADYYLDKSYADDTHYIDAVINIHPNVLKSRDAFLNAFEAFKRRREHVHVWNRDSFNNFLLNAMNFLKVENTVIFHNEDEMECTYIIKIGKDENNERLKSSIALLSSIYLERNDLQEVFNGNILNVLNWAIECGTGMYRDVDENILAQYEVEYKKLKEQETQFIEYWNMWQSK